MFQASNLSCYDKSQQAQGKLPICQYWHEEDTIEDMIDIDYYNQNYLLSLMNGIDFLLRLYSKSENKETAVLFTFDKVRKLYQLNQLVGGGASLPDQTGNYGKFLITDGNTVSWTDTLSKLIILTTNTFEAPIFSLSAGGQYDWSFYIQQTGLELHYGGYKNNVLKFPTTGGTLARIEDLQNETTTLNAAIAGKQDKLTAGENITIEDGVISATGGGELPDNVLTNLVVDSSAVENSSVIVYGTPNNAWCSTVLGAGANNSNGYGTVVGYKAKAGARGIAVGVNSKSENGIAIGSEASSESGIFSIAIGNNATAKKGHSIALGYYANTEEDNTFVVGLGWDAVNSRYANYKLLGLDGTIPAARHANLPAEDGTYVLKCVITDGVPTVSWVRE